MISTTGTLIANGIKLLDNPGSIYISPSVKVAHSFCRLPLSILLSVYRHCICIPNSVSCVGCMAGFWYGGA